jgi:hypothetical protein
MEGSVLVQLQRSSVDLGWRWAGYRDVTDHRQADVSRLVHDADPRVGLTDHCHDQHAKPVAVLQSPIWRRCPAPDTQGGNTQKYGCLPRHIISHNLLLTRSVHSDKSEDERQKPTFGGFVRSILFTDILPSLLML